MKTLKFMPEGWNNEISTFDLEGLEKCRQKGQVLQGLVKNCDEDFNLHINFENGLTGIIPRQEVEGINLEEDGLPKTNLCTGKVHKFVQFKIFRYKK